VVRKNEEKDISIFVSGYLDLEEEPETPEDDECEEGCCDGE